MVFGPEVLLHLPLVSAAVWLANGLWPWSRGLRTSPEWAFVAASLLAGLWAFLDWVFLHTADKGDAVFVSRIRITMLTLASIAFLYFGRWLTRPRGRVDALALVPVAATIAISWTVLTTDAERAWWGWRLIRDPVWYAVWAAQVAAYLFAAFAYVGWALRRATFATDRTRTKLVAIFIALAIAVGGWLSTNAYDNLTQAGGFPAFSSILVVPGLLLLVFLAPVSRRDLAAMLRRLTLAPARPFAAIWYHNSGQPLAQVVLPGERPPDALVLSDLARAVDHILSPGLSSVPGKLREIRHEEHTFVFEQGRHLTLAVLVRGRPSEGLRSEFRQALQDFEEAYGPWLVTRESAASVAEQALNALDEVLSPRTL